MQLSFQRPLTLSITILWAGTCLLSPLVSANEAPVAVPQNVLKSLERNQIPKDAVSISVIEIEPVRQGKNTSKNILDWRAEELMNPASTMKLLTTLAGLDILGPQYRWRTNLYTDGLIRQGTLKGNLYLQGTGDSRRVI